MTRTTGPSKMGRPRGTGRLGAGVVRVTVRLPQALYTRLEAFAAGRQSLPWCADNTLADVVRDAITHYLACPQRHMKAEE